VIDVFEVVGLLGNGLPHGGDVGMMGGEEALRHLLSHVLRVPLETTLEDIRLEVDLYGLSGMAQRRPRLDLHAISAAFPDLSQGDGVVNGMLRPYHRLVFGLQCFGSGWLLGVWL